MSGNDSEFQKVTWSEVERLIKVLAEKITSLDRDFSSITTISRGGLVPARLLADHLGIDSIIVDAKKIASDSIFVDDIYDSGTTFKKIINRVDNPSKFVYVTLFARRGKKYPKQLIFGKKTNTNSYLVYPWDKLEYKRLKKYGL
ncbi:MAG: phosphoribosyltransferase [Nitrosopumilaceae archaeon]|uniref:Phosphoribosyltransferase n=3 Tax=Candidatus Nitrosomaritimum aestuariumsis TaxID=3342354 RepID=A0AC60W3Y6_9ARCH|nr:phosphoribosyltransferase [Nitrosopumilaceae archaeon]MBA4454485.1 phosphoribosyltransferase [Nitrosopumilaceae archaeon]MBA4460277.1 phosphoribosyltransferase [Nitrosopumilaceae archaeon]MBA4461242.1 phosphoribosyltransferase [Nitrosopumilaceae archaeon]MBA4463908.1 phosphoribosyltransferase [Nitrosopumilaceae archaeon]